MDDQALATPIEGGGNLEACRGPNILSLRPKHLPQDGVSLRRATESWAGPTRRSGRGRIEGRF